MRRLLFAPLLLPVIVIGLCAQEVAFDTVRVCTYNPGLFETASLDRIDELRRVLDAIGPRILCVQEIRDYESLKIFRDSVAELLGRPLALASYFIMPPDFHPQESYALIFYDRSAFSEKEPLFVFDGTRALLSVRFLHNASGDSIQIMTTGWNGGDDGENVMRRRESAGIVHKALIATPPGYVGVYDDILLAGALNLHGSDEPAYQSLVGPDSGIFVDPIDRPGAWHGNAAFADIQTYDTRSGLIDRFDQILLTPALMPRYLPGSYTVFGNDGAHFGDSVAALPNDSVSPELARTLQDASAHLPVYVDLLFERPSSDVPEPSSMRELDLTIRGRR